MAPFTPRFARRLNHRVRRNQRQILLVNAGAARREVVNGREFLVAPMTIIVPGVLPGSRGALLYPPSEVAKEPGLWNGVPIVRNHPVENGRHVSGRTPSAMASVEMGRVFNDRWDGSKRVADGWFDVESTRRVDPAILNRLERGDSIELSTGLFTDNQSRTGTYNGKRYDAIAYNYRPDHLAILPDQKGACSRADGCGVMVNEDTGVGGVPGFAPRKQAPAPPKAPPAPKAALVGSPEAAQRVAAQTPGPAKNAFCPDGMKVKNQNGDQSGPACTCSGTCGKCASAPVGKTKNSFCPTGSGGGVDPSCGSSGGGGGGSPNPKDVRKELRDSTRGVKEARAALAKVKDEAAGSAAAGAAGLAAIDKLREDSAADHSTKMAAMRAEHEQLTARMAATRASLKAGKKTKNESSMPLIVKNQVTNQRSSFMAGKNNQRGNRDNREQALERLAVNSRRFGAPEVQDTLAELPEDVLAEVAANSEFAAEKTLVCNALAEMFPDVNDVVANGGDLKAFLKSKMGAGQGADDEDEDDSELEYGGKAKNASSMQGESGGGSVTKAGEQKGTPQIDQGNGMTGNRKRGSFSERLAREGTAEEKAVWNHAVENERRERVGLLQRITANCADRNEARQLWDEFKKMELPKLRLVADHLAPVNNEERGGNGLFGVGRRIPDYGGSEGATFVGNRRGVPADDDVLDLPDGMVANEQGR